jgi:choline dehydrogenase-like flavoprotein
MGRMQRQEHDIIIVGAGAAGCVLSARLSEPRTTRVRLLEAGTAKAPLASRIPAAYSKLFKSRHDWDYQTQPERALGGRQLYIPRGKLLGGSSAMNAMIYIRGNSSTTRSGSLRAPRAGATRMCCRSFCSPRIKRAASARTMVWAAHSGSKKLAA